MTTHEHWLVCPLHVLWKYDRTVCETEECVRCCAALRPPAPVVAEDRPDGTFARAPRRTDLPEHLDHARARPRGIKAPMTHLPYFLPPDYTGLPEARVPDHARPYVAAAGRLEKIKGFQDVIEAMRRLPKLDLRIAGSGQYEEALRARARGLANVHFEGRLDAAQVAALFRGRRQSSSPRWFTRLSATSCSKRSPKARRSSSATSAHCQSSLKRARGASSSTRRKAWRLARAARDRRRAPRFAWRQRTPRLPCALVRIQAPRAAISH